MAEAKKFPGQLVFGLDIGTRSIVGTVGYRTGGKFHVVTQSIREHQTRAMLDGQIHDIYKVGGTIKEVKAELEERIGRTLKDVCIAAAGRVLQTVTLRVDQDLEGEREVNGEDIYALDSLGVERAYAEFLENNNMDMKFYCVGYSVVRYYMNGYTMGNLEGHKAKTIGEDLIATFLPEDVVDGLYKAVGVAAEGITVEVAFQYVNEFHENVLGFCNNIYNAEGGTHLTGFKTMFTNVINTYARGLNILKEKDVNFTGADVRNGMTAVVSIKHPDPRFEGQTKTKLDNQDAAKIVSKVTGDEIVRFFDRNLETLKSIIGCAEKAAKIRKTEEKAKTNMLTKQKFSFDSNGKLANCESKDASKCEIFIVEGDSAGGSAKMARNRMFQAILPIRGKILNVEKASIDKVLANAEIKTMINAFGCGFSEGYGNDFDISKLRYDKIIIMADADVDGEHISNLLLTLFYRFMPELIYEGHVYIAMPPLYKAMPSKGEEEYLYDDKALEKYRKKHKGPFTLQRYKGLGEMDAQQLWETTLDPDARLLKLVEIEDARMASEVTELLMGTEVPPRKEFIYRHAQDAELDV